MSTFSRLVRRLGPMGGYSAARFLCRNEPRVLMYHRFADPPRPGCTSTSFFEAQVQHVLKHYNPMTLANLLLHVDRHGAAPTNAVVLTVDDGYADFYDIAFPILRKYSLPLTVFVATDFINGELWLWPDKISWLLDNTERVSEKIEVAGHSIQSGKMTSARRFGEWRSLVDALLSVPDSRKHMEISVLGGALGLEVPEKAPEEYKPMSWEQLSELEAFGIEIGGHTVTHPSLGQVTQNQADDEIIGCMKELSRQLGNQPRTFCYPNGQVSDYTPAIQKTVSEAGFLGAVTAFPDSKGFRERFAIRRHVSGDDMFQFYKGVSGLELLGHRFRRNFSERPDNSRVLEYPQDV